MPVRYIILGTQHLSALISNYEDSDRLSNEIAKEAENRFNTVYKDKIKDHIERSFFYGDVPYFTLLGNNLYYGDVCDPSYLIAEGFKE